MTRESFVDSSDAGTPPHVRTPHPVAAGQRVTLTASQDRVLVFPAELGGPADRAPQLEAAAL